MTPLEGPCPRWLVANERQVVISLRTSVEDRQQAFQELDALNKGGFFNGEFTMRSGWIYAVFLVVV